MALGSAITAASHIRFVSHCSPPIRLDGCWLHKMIEIRGLRLHRHFPTPRLCYHVSRCHCASAVPYWGPTLGLKIVPPWWKPQNMEALVKAVVRNSTWMWSLLNSRHKGPYCPLRQCGLLTHKCRTKTGEKGICGTKETWLQTRAVQTTWVERGRTERGSNTSVVSGPQGPPPLEMFYLLPVTCWDGYDSQLNTFLTKR